MTRDEATAEVARRQRLHFDAKWVAVQRDGEWVVARIALAPTVIAQTGTATKPPPTAPRDDPYSQLEIITRLYGASADRILRYAALPTPVCSDLLLLGSELAVCLTDRGDRSTPRGPTDGSRIAPRVGVGSEGHGVRNPDLPISTAARLLVELAAGTLGIPSAHVAISENCAAGSEGDRKPPRDV